mgnify:CR=1 FL=1
MRTILRLACAFLFSGFFINNTYSQDGGSSTFDFLNVTRSARVAALGGNYLAIKDNDITLAYTNPSLITPEMNNNLALSFVDYFSDINYGFASYGRSFTKAGSFVGTLQFIDYGQFNYSDAAGNTLGNFAANEMALNIGWGRSLDSLFSIGAAVKGIYSSFDSYTASGIAVDAAATYHNPAKRLTVSLIASNIGMQLQKYRTGDREPLPFEIGIGLSKRLEHMPLRFSVLLTHLEKWDLTYDDPLSVEKDPITGEIKEPSKLSDFADKFMRHVVIGAEFQPFKALSIRLGYNYKRRQEMKVESKLSTIGFSWGVGLQVSKFNFSYARSTDHLAGSPNYITITTNFDTFKKR